MPSSPMAFDLLASLDVSEALRGQMNVILSHLQQRTDEGDDEHHRTPFAARAPPQLPLL